jgi:starch phosphorylase
VKRTLVPDFHRLWPERFNNKTNGITPRRWLLKANPALASLVTEAVGAGWVTDLSQLRALEQRVDDVGFQDAFMGVKLANKTALARVIRETTSVVVDPTSMFDIQAKRIHEYKRQLLNALHIAHQYLAIVEDGVWPSSPKTYVFAGKAAPGYFRAKLIIKLINSIAETVNGDTRVGDQLRVVFVPDYRVSLAERIVAAADLSEQISTAGKEASGTGNMKFALNGAVTIGTLDGANIEIRQEVGDENIYIFGLMVDEVEALHRVGYNPRSWYESNPMLARTLDAIRDGRFCPRERGLFQPLIDQLLGRDEYLHLADFASYIAAQARALHAFGQKQCWTRQAMLNTARVGFFSSDRTVAEYARDIWHVEAL